MAPVATGPPAADIVPTPIVKPKVANIDEEIQHDKSTMSKSSRSAFPKPPVFEDKMEERAYLKFRLAQAFRIFGKLGYDEGVAGHITVRVRTLIFVCVIFKIIILHAI